MNPVQVRNQKWRLLLGLVIYVLVVQWVLLIPVVILLLGLGLVHQVVHLPFQLATYFFRTRPKETPQKTVLINGCSQAVALHLARLLNTSGHRVIACDYSVHLFNPTRFSNAVDAYYTVPNPRRGLQEYIRYLCMIAEKEQVDLFIPVSRPEDLHYDMRTKVPLERNGCRVYMLSPWKRLSVGNNNNDNSIASYETTPKTLSERRRSDEIKKQVIQEAERFSYKDCFEYLPKLVDDLSTLQMWNHEKYTSTCFITEGRVIGVATVPCDPDSRPYHWDGVNEQVLKWAYVILKQLTTSAVQSGALTFELVMTHEGRVFPIGCSPQIGEATLIFKHDPDMVNCILQPESVLPSRPFQSVGGPQRYCLYPEVWETLKHPVLSRWQLLVSQMWNSKEAFFEITDPIPFFASYHLHLPFQAALQMLQGKSWVTTDYITGKLVV